MKINSLEFLMDILYSLEKKRNDMIHSKKYYTEISGIFGMTTIIIMRIENSNEFLKIVLASLYAVICVFMQFKLVEMQRKVLLKLINI